MSRRQQRTVSRGSRELGGRPPAAAAEDVQVRYKNSLAPGSEAVAVGLDDRSAGETALNRAFRPMLEHMQAVAQRAYAYAVLSRG